ncbi:MAG TPA: HAD-IA family hydrolase [Polyangiales bacterium]|nr:HAD-IA family hydrolase [Polyangiales bacterium]
MTERLIAIDLDGTIEDSRDDMVAAARRVRAALALPPRPDAALRPHVNGGMDHLYRACFDDFLAADPEHYARVRSAYEADYLANVAVETRMYPGMGAALAELSQLGELVCVTNKPEHISRHLLEELGVGQLFSTVVGGDSCEHCKPHPIMLVAAAERCGLREGEHRTIMIGDTQADVQLGRAYGARTIWCAWGYVDALQDRADVEVLTPADLPRAVSES